MRTFWQWLNEAVEHDPLWYYYKHIGNNVDLVKGLILGTPWRDKYAIPKKYSNPSYFDPAIVDEAFAKSWRDYQAYLQDTTTPPRVKIKQIVDNRENIEEDKRKNIVIKVNRPGQQPTDYSIPIVKLGREFLSNIA